jgi:quercetin dioxygenase-like cupin family protein
MLLTLGLASVVAPARAGSSKEATTVQELMKQPVPNLPGTDVVVITVEYAPGASTPPHEHPGSTYAYVLKGSVTSKLGDQEAHTYTKGQMWSETPHQHHMVSKNASKTEPAELLVFMVVPHGEKQLTTMLPAKP